MSVPLLVGKIKRKSIEFIFIYGQKGEDISRLMKSCEKYEVSFVKSSHFFLTGRFYARIQEKVLYRQDQDRFMMEIRCKSLDIFFDYWTVGRIMTSIDAPFGKVYVFFILHLIVDGLKPPKIFFLIFPVVKMTSKYFS